VAAAPTACVDVHVVAAVLLSPSWSSRRPSKSEASCGPPSARQKRRTRGWLGRLLVVVDDDKAGLPPFVGVRSAAVAAPPSAAGSVRRGGRRALLVAVPPRARRRAPWAAATR
jgi:hypothetical protein